MKRRAAALAAALLMAACGGGGGDDAASCPVATEQNWLRGYMADWYLWAGQSPNPAPDNFATVADYYAALKFQGNATVPADRWSFWQTTASFSQFFTEGRTMSYGIFVNGNERQLPLRVRMTEPKSPAAAAGLVRGDSIVSINGVTAADLIVGDFAVLAPSKVGDQITVVADTLTGRRTFVLTAAEFDLTPVPVSTMLTTGNGIKVGYLAMKDFITQGEATLATDLANIRSQGATQLILDLRYNGGGRVSTANVLASLIVGGTSAPNRVFAKLRYNAAHQNSNNDIALQAQSTVPFSRVVVLTGSRTCSASELVVNGLTPFTEVVTIGGTTCGKPVGFNPSSQCGNTYSAVTFEAFNRDDQGRYYNGLAPTCPVAEDFTGTLGDPAEKLTAAALTYLQTGACPVAGVASPAAASLRRRLGVEPGDRQGMTAD